MGKGKSIKANPFRSAPGALVAVDVARTFRLMKVYNSSNEM